ncbi:MAG TPA: thiamine-phosphate kinase, partial [Vicinamibacterales bacterium]|nr:thiamine-phosphate kinase [Vicinamibacterales bacterium]
MLARIRARLPRPPTSVIVGVGDDAAVVAPARNIRLVLTTDALVEGVHFERAFSVPADIGYKALAVNLSDLAAMGATPEWALLSLALPDDAIVDEVEALVGGLADLASKENLAVVGGNVTRSPGPLVIDVTAVGSVHPRRFLTRSGGRPGDDLYLSGSVGAGAAGLEMLQAGERSGEGSGCIGRYQRPPARVRLGRALAHARAARAAMDLSDGLADAVRQVAQASGCGAEVIESALPIAEAARKWWDARGVDAVRAALTGGDDYELLV